MNMTRFRFRRLSFVVLFVAAGWFGLLSSAAEKATPQQQEADLYKGWVAQLASEDFEGRAPGLKGIEKAREFLMKHFQEAGLKPAFGGKYTQELQVSTGIQVRKQELAVVGASGEAKAAKASSDFAAFGFSGNGAFEGELVFVGYGITDKDHEYNNYENVAVDALKGKIAVAFRYEPHDAEGKSLFSQKGKGWSGAAGLIPKIKAAADHGATAMLIVNPPSHNGKRDRPRRSAGLRTGAGAKIPVLQIDLDWFKTLLESDGADVDKTTLHSLLEKANDSKTSPTPLGVSLRGAVELKAQKTPTHNVAAVLPGVGALAEEYVIVGAHYDHVGFGNYGSRGGHRGQIHPGADDNASGAAGVMLLARRFARVAEGTDPAAPRRTMVFACFTAEEMGLLGSRYMANHLDQLGVKAGQIAAMVNLDMIGRLRNDRCSVWGADSGSGLRDIVEQANQSIGLTLSVSGSGFAPSDNTSFYREKIPVLSFFTGVHEDYHTPRDTADKINAAGAVHVVDLAGAVLTRLATTPQRPAYQPPQASGKGAFLGVTFAEAEHRCEVGEVIEGSAAEQAGLRAGDIIVGWDDEEVKTAEDLLARIRTRKPGEKVKLRLQRGETIIEKEVTLGKRG
jgi:hypothetical protein